MSGEGHMSIASQPGGRNGGSSWINDPKTRSIVFQVALVVLVVALVAWLANNTMTNMARLGTRFSYSYLGENAGYPISPALIEYSVSASSYGRALVVGLLNTLLAAGIGLVLATILGFIIGIARLSSNWLIAKIAQVYIEIFRNIPPVLQLMFWYALMRTPMPDPKNSFVFFNVAFLNKRGLYLPSPNFGDGSILILLALLVAIAVTVYLVRRARKLQAETGRRPRVIFLSLALLIGLPVIAFLAAGMPITANIPVHAGFNIGPTTGPNAVLTLGPELIGIVFGLSIYTAAFIAEIVRGGILSISHGQTEAARALGLTNGQNLRLVTVPQAVRVIIPPLTNQYLNLTKNTSLGHFIGYADLTLVNETAMNQSQHTIEGMSIVMLIYLVISIITSILMNWFNKRVALVER
jgi:general L-amino acid transport system permease protein